MRMGISSWMCRVRLAKCWCVVNDNMNEENDEIREKDFRILYNV